MLPFGDDVRGLMILVVLTASVAGTVFGVYIVLRAVIRPHHDRDRGVSSFGDCGDDAAGPYHHGELGIHHGHHGGDNHAS